MFLRFLLYIALILFSFILFSLTAARIHYTENLPSDDPLNSGRDFYDPVVAELLVVSLLTCLITPLFALTIHRHFSNQRFTRIWFEVLVLGILWLMLLVGAADASSIWPDLSFCSQFNACRVLMAMLAFAWLSWIVMTLLLFSSIFYAVRYRAWSNHIHEFEWRRGEGDKELGPEGTIGWRR